MTYAFTITSCQIATYYRYNIPFHDLVNQYAPLHFDFLIRRCEVFHYFCF